MIKGYIFFTIIISMLYSQDEETKADGFYSKIISNQSEQNHLSETIPDYISVDDRIRIDLFGIRFRGPFELCQTLIAFFLMIVFIQSGVDKIFNKKDNLNFFNNHFSKTIFKNLTPLLLHTLAVLELIGGFVLAYGIFHALYFLETIWIFNGFVILSITVILLMFGQRIAKDYVGAADLVPYFILIMLGIMSMY